MKYMTFNSSCSYCAVANMLEYRGINTSDAELAIGAHIPYLLRYDPEDGGYFLTGAMLQKPQDFNRALAPYGLQFSESIVNKADVEHFLAEHIPCMTGLMQEHGRHAMVFTGTADGKFQFVNPHREDDGQQDMVILTKTELLDSLREKSAVGWISEHAAECPKGETQRSLETLDSYRGELLRFLRVRHTREDLLANRDRLLRPLAIDLPAAMSLVGEDAFVRDLLCLQQQALTLFHQEECIPMESVNAELLGKCLDEWEKQMREHPL